MVSRWNLYRINWFGFVEAGEVKEPEGIKNRHLGANDEAGPSYCYFSRLCHEMDHSSGSEETLRPHSSVSESGLCVEHAQSLVHKKSKSLAASPMSSVSLTLTQTKLLHVYLWWLCLMPSIFRSPKDGMRYWTDWIWQLVIFSHRQDLFKLLTYFIK